MDHGGVGVSVSVGVGVIVGAEVFDGVTGV